MPFGAIFGSLFLILLAVWLMVGADQAPLWPRLFLAVAALSLALGLLLRRNWARWAGVGFAAAVALLMSRWFSIEPGVGPLVFVIGALAVAALLVVPATGAPGKLRPVSPVVGRTIFGLTAAGVLGFAGSVWLVGIESGANVEAAARAAQLASDRAYTRVAWRDFGSGAEAATADDRPMMVVFMTSWCGYCKKMDRNTFKDPAVIEALSELVAVRVDTEDNEVRNGYRGAQLASEFGIRGTPTVALLSPRGEILAKRSGYLDARDFLDWLGGSLPAQGRRSPDVIRLSTP